MSHVLAFLVLEPILSGVDFGWECLLSRLRHRTLQKCSRLGCLAYFLLRGRQPALLHGRRSCCSHSAQNFQAHCASPSWALLMSRASAAARYWPGAASAALMCRCSCFAHAGKGGLEIHLVDLLPGALNACVAVWAIVALQVVAALGPELEAVLVAAGDIFSASPSSAACSLHFSGLAISKRGATSWHLRMCRNSCSTCYRTLGQKTIRCRQTSPQTWRLLRPVVRPGGGLLHVPKGG